MSIAAINNPVSVPRNARRDPAVRPAVNASGKTDGGRRGTPVERVIEGEVVGRPGASGAQDDPFARVRFGQGGAAGRGLHAMLGISAYLANSAATPAGDVARHVDYYA